MALSAALAAGIIASRNGNAIIVPSPRSMVRRPRGLLRTIIAPAFALSSYRRPSQHEGRARHDALDDRLDAIAVRRRAARDLADGGHVARANAAGGTFGGGGGGAAASRFSRIHLPRFTTDVWLP